MSERPTRRQAFLAATNPAQLEVERLRADLDRAEELLRGAHYALLGEGPSSLDDEIAEYLDLADSEKR